MKRFFFLLAFLALALPLSAQEDPIIPERETVFLDNFTAVPNMTLGLYQYARQSVLDGLSRRRIEVIDVDRYGVGRTDIVYPSFNFAVGYAGQPYDYNRVMHCLNEHPDARWYMTVYISHLRTHPVEHKSKDKDGNPAVKVDHTCDLDADVYLFDRETRSVNGPIRWHTSYSGAADPAYAERHAVSYLSDKARSFVEDFFRFKASVIKLGEYNKRGKLEDLYLSCGSNIGVERGDVFYIYSITETNGIETARKIGKVKAREITGPDSCRCTVSNGEVEINTAFLAGDRLVAVSDTDRFF